MKKRLVLTSVFALMFGCLVSYADVSPRGGNKGPEKPKTVKVDNKRDNKKPAVKPAAKPAPKPVAHKPAPKPNNKPVAHKPVAHKPNHKPAPKPVAHKPAPKPAPVCHLNHHHNDHCCKPAPKPTCCNKSNHHNCSNVNGVVAGAVTTAAVIGLIAAIAN